MYPDRELTRLTVHKAVLWRDIALRHSKGAEAAAPGGAALGVAGPDAAFWRRLSPLAAVPLGFHAKRTFVPT
jgi:hypothetical protein